MNKNLYKVIFSKKLGIKVVVAENTTQEGKGKGEYVGATASNADANMLLALKNLSLSVLLACGAAIFIVQTVQASTIITDKTAPKSQQATVLTTGGAAPLVNIQKPTDRGVSMNQYKQFDVDQAGAVLNNSRQTIQTQLAGVVPGNPWLGKGEARVIVNQINSNDPSQLKGFIEVAGRRAEVIIANPSGIQVNGSGFINASKAILTTGLPIINAGNLEGYRVQAGQISVEGQGLNNSAVDYTAILAKTAKLSAGVWAKKLDVVLGGNTVTVDGEDAKVEPQASATANSQSYALDTAALGGMYADKIKILSTDKGVGVNNAGKWVVSQGDIQISADGKLTNSGVVKQNSLDHKILIKTATVDNSGQLASVGKQKITANQLTNTKGLISADKDLELNIVSAIDNSEGKISAQHLDIKAASLKNDAGSIEQFGAAELQVTAEKIKVAKDGVLGQELAKDNPTPANSINPTIDNSTSPSQPTNPVNPAQPNNPTTPVQPTQPVVAKAGRIKITGNIDNGSGNILATGAVDVHASSLDNAGLVNIKRLDVKGGDFTNTAKIYADQANDIDVAKFSNTTSDADIQIRQELKIKADDFKNNSKAKIVTGKQFDLHAQQVNNDGGKIHSDATLTVVADKDISNKAGTLTAKDKLTLSALQGKLTNDANGEIKSGTDIEINAKDVINQKSKIAATDKLNITASKTLINTNKGIETDENTISAKELTVTAQNITNTGKAKLVSTGATILTADQVLDNSKGEIVANDKLTITAGKTINKAGTLSAKQALELKSGTGEVDNTGGKIVAEEKLNISAKSLVNSQKGKINSLKELTLDVSQGIDNSSKGEIKAAHLDINAASLKNDDGAIKQFGKAELQVTAKKIKVAKGGVLGQELAKDNPTPDNSTTPAQPTNSANPTNSTKPANTAVPTTDQSTAAVTADQAISQTTTTEKAKAGLINITGDIDNGSGKILATGVVDVHASSLDNAGLVNIKVLDVKGGDFTNTAKIYADQANDIDVAKFSNTTSDADIQIRQELKIKADDFKNNSKAKIATGKQFDLHAQQVNNDAGKIHSDATLTVVADKDVSNKAGTLTAKDKLTLSALQGKLTNDGKGEIKSGTDIEINAKDVINQNSKIAATDKLNITASKTLINTNKGIETDENTISAKELTVTAQNITNTGKAKLESTGATILTADQVLDNSEGQIVANDKLTITAGKTINKAGTLSAKQALELKSGTGEVDNTGGTIVAEEKLNISAKSLVNSQKGKINSLKELTLDVSQGIDNSSKGEIKAAHLDINAASLKNDDGAIKQFGKAELQVTAEKIKVAKGGVLGQELAKDNPTPDNSTTPAQPTNSANPTNSTKPANTAVPTTDQSNTAVVGGQAISQTTTTEKAKAGLIKITGDIDNGSGKILANAAVDVHASSLDNAGLVNIKTLDVKGGDFSNTAKIYADQANDIKVNNFSNTTSDADIQIRQELKIKADDFKNNSKAKIVTGKQFDLHAQQVNNDGGKIHSDATLTVVADKDISNKAGTLTAKDKLTLSALQGKLTNDANGEIKSGTDIEINAKDVINQNSKIAATDKLNITASQSLTNTDNATISGDTLEVTAPNISNTNKAKLDSTGSTTITATQVLDNSEGQIVANDKLTITAGKTINKAGILSAKQALELKSGTGEVDNTGGKIVAEEKLNISAKSLVNSQKGKINSLKELTLDVSQGIDNSSKGEIKAAHLDINAASLKNDDGAIKQFGKAELQVTAEKIKVAKGGVLGQELAKDNPTPDNSTTPAQPTNSANPTNSTQPATTAAPTTDQSNTAVAGGQTTNQTTPTEKAKAGQIKITGDIDNGSGKILANAAVDVHASSLDNAGLVNIKTLDVKGGNFTNTAKIYADQANDIDVAKFSNTTSDADIQIRQELKIKADDFKNNSKAKIATGQQFDLTAQQVNNDAGKIHSDATLTIVAEKDLSNKAGKLTAKDKLTLSALQGKLTNDGKGEIQSGTDIKINAKDVINQNSKIAATNKLNITASQSLTNTDNATISGDTLEVTAPNISNTNKAKLDSTGSTTITATQVLDNSKGEIVANDKLTITAGKTINKAGTLSAKQALELKSGTGEVDNTGGTIVAEEKLNISAKSLVNSQKGKINSLKELTLDVSQGIDNSSKGEIKAAHLDINAASLKNDDGAIKQFGKAELQVTAEKIKVAKGGVLGQQLVKDNPTPANSTTPAQPTNSANPTNSTKPANTAVPTTDQSTAAVTADQAISQTTTTEKAKAGLINITGDIDNGSGKILATGVVDVHASSLDNAGLVNIKRLDVKGGDFTNTAKIYADQANDIEVAKFSNTTSDADIQIRQELKIKADDFKNNSKAKIVTGKQFDLHAQQVNNDAGKIHSDATLTIVADKKDISNSAGEIIANDKLTLAALQGTLTNNTKGKIQSRANDVQVDAKVVHNKDGEIAAKSKLTINSTDSIDNSNNGKISANEIKLDAKNLNNSQKGDISATGKSNITVGERLNNNTGTIAATDNLVLTAQHLSNKTGVISSQKTATINAQHTVNSLQGSISGENVTIKGQELDNSNGEVFAKHQLTLELEDQLENNNGSIVAGETKNKKIISQGNLTITAKKQLNELNNQAGKILSNGLIVLNALQIDNSNKGNIGAKNLQVTGDQFNNSAQGEVSVDEQLTLDIKQKINNQQGKLIAGEQLTIKDNQLLDNRHGGQIGGGKNIDITSKTIEQAKEDSKEGSLINASNLVKIKSDLINNAGSEISAGTLLDIESKTLNNQNSGQLLSNQDLTFKTKQLNNSNNGVIKAANLAKLKSDNINNEGGVIQAKTVEATTKQLDNSSNGLIEADGKLQLDVSQRLNNNQGQIRSVKADVLINDKQQQSDLQLTNTNGTIEAAQDVTIVAQSTGLDGTLQAKRDLNLTQQKDILVQKLLKAGGNLNLTTKGNFTNQSDVQVGDKLTVHANEIDNQQNAKIQAINAIDLRATNNITNAGLINTNGLTRLQAGKQINNQGTGKIFGNHIAMQADELHNVKQGDKAGVIVARERLDLGVKRIYNIGSGVGTVYTSGVAKDGNNSSTISSEGTLHVGAELDKETNQATGSAKYLENKGALIESAGDMYLNTKILHNEASDFDVFPLSYHEEGEDIVAYNLVGTGNWHKAGVDGEWIREGEKNRRDTHFLLYKDKENKILPTRPSGYPDEPYQFNYTNINNKKYTSLKEAQKDYKKLKAAYDEKYYQEYSKYYAETDSSSATWFIKEYKQHTYKDEIKTLQPSKISVGKDLFFYGDKLLNDKGQILIGGILKGDISSLENTPMLANVEKKEIGKLKKTYWKSHKTKRDNRKYDNLSDINDLVPTGKEPFNTDFVTYQEHASTSQSKTADPTIEKQEVQTAPGVDPSIKIKTLADNPIALPKSSLYTVDVNDPDVLIKTDPALTQGVTFDGIPTKTGTNAVNIDHTKQQDFKNQSINGKVLAQTSTNAVNIDNLNLQDLKNLILKGKVSAQTGTNAVNIEGLTKQELKNLILDGKISVQTGTNAVNIDGSAQQDLHNKTTSQGNSVNVQIGNPNSFTVQQGTGYMLQAFKNDPQNMHKRLGDSYYEQRLINEQIAQLTGHRRLDGYSNDIEQFKALMDAGITFAKAQGLVPGIALSEAQVKRLTSDMVWLQTQNVTMPNGSVQTVLVPKVYVVARAGDVNTAGSLISADHIDLEVKDLKNAGAIIARHNNRIVGDNITNEAGGHIGGRQVSLYAKQDIVNEGKVRAQDRLVAIAERDIITKSTTTTVGDKDNGSTQITNQAGFYIDNQNSSDGTLGLKAGRNIEATAAEFVNNSQKGKTILDAKDDIKLKTLAIEQHTSYGKATDGDHLIEHKKQEVGTTLQGNADIIANAGNKLSIRQADINSEQAAVKLFGKKGVEIVEGRYQQEMDQATHNKQKGLFSSKTTDTQYKYKADLAQGSNITGKKVQVGSEQGDVLVQGSNIVSDEKTQISGENVSIVSAEQSVQEFHGKQETKSGLMGTGGFGIFLGKKGQDNGNTQASHLHQGSSVHSLNGEVEISARNHYHQKGSSVAAGTEQELDKFIQAKQSGKGYVNDKNNVTIIAKTEQIEHDTNTIITDNKQTFEQKGITASVSAPVLSAIEAVKGLKSSTEKVGKSKNKRVNAMAAFNSGVSAYKAGTAIASAAQNLSGQGAGGVTVSVSYGEQKNENRSTTVEQQTAASQVIGLGTVTLATTGNKDESHIDITGSDVIGANKTKLHTEGNINLTAADEQTSNRSNNKSQGFNAGVAVTFDKGMSLGFTVGGNYGKGHSNTDSLTHRNTNVGGFGMGQSSSDNTEIYAGKDLIQTGAGVYGNKIDVDVENLIQKSLQDTEVSNSKQLNVNAQGTFGYGVSVSGSVSGSKSKGDYAAVNEQAGIFAGDGGYDVNVRNHTDQTGAIITSTAKAEQQGLNSFTTGTYSKKDIENHADYDAKSLAIGGGFAKNGTGENKHHLTEQNPGSKDASISKSIGFGSDSGHETTTTASGVNTANMKITNAKAQQQLTGTTAAQTIADAKTKFTTEDIFNGANGNLKNNYDKDEVQQEVELQAQVSKESDENRQFVKQKINTQIKTKQDAAKDKLEQAKQLAQDNPEQAKKLETEADQLQQQASNWKKAGLLADSIAAGLSTPSTSIGGSLVAAATPMMAQQIGQYFHALEAKNQDGKLTGKQETAHVLAHTILGAATALATGNNALSSGLAAGGAETVAPLIQNYLYPDVKTENLTPEQKATVNNIASLAGASVAGLTSGGNGADIVAGNNLAANAVDNNHLHTIERVSVYPNLLTKQKENNCGDNPSSNECQKIAKEIKRLDEQGSSIHKIEPNSDTDMFPNEVVGKGITNAPGDLVPCIGSASSNGVCVVSTEEKKVGWGQHPEWKLQPASDEQAAAFTMKSAESSKEFNKQMNEYGQEAFKNGLTFPSLDSVLASAFYVAGGNNPFTGEPYSDKDRALLGINAVLNVSPIVVPKVTEVFGGIKSKGFNSPVETPNRSLTKDYFKNTYGENNVNQGGGNRLKTTENVNANVQDTKLGNDASNFNKHVENTNRIVLEKQNDWRVPNGQHQVIKVETTKISGVTVLDKKSGKTITGTVDLQPTIDRINKGGKAQNPKNLKPHNNDGTIYRNDPDKTTGKILLPVKENGYYTEYVVPPQDKNFTFPGAQRVIVGKQGELYYTPDHYTTPIRVK